MIKSYESNGITKEFKSNMGALSDICDIENVPMLTLYMNVGSIKISQMREWLYRMHKEANPQADIDEFKKWFNDIENATDMYNILSELLKSLFPGPKEEEEESKGKKK